MRSARRSLDCARENRRSPRAPSERQWSCGSSMLTPRTHAVSGRLRASIEVDDLVQRMYAGIGASRALSLHRMRSNLRQRSLDGVLHPTRDGWLCQPQKPLPSYSSERAMRI